MIADNLEDETASTGRGGSVARAAADIRGLILQRQLLPGVQVRQEDLAQQIGTSRGPIREALQVLTAEGVLRYERNRGYFVTRFTVEEMRQLYRIRDLLESELLDALPGATRTDVDLLKSLNEQIRSGEGDVDVVISLNRQFHDLVFAPSPLSVFRAELAHISRMTTAYQALSINALDNWDLLANDHDLIISALEQGDAVELVRMHRVHRDRSLARLEPMLR